MRPMLIGLAPRENEGLVDPLCAGAVGKRLAGLCGLDSPHEIADLFETRYLYKDPLPDAKVQDWDEARRLATILRRKFLSRRVVLFGSEVRRAYGIKPSAHLPLHYFEMGPTWVALCPYPSGRQSWWTEPGNLYRTQEFFAALVMEARR